MAQEEAVDRAVALSGRIFEATLGSLELFTIYLGDKLGLYAALAGSGPATSVELAEGTNTAERYVREWLEQQAVAGILEVEDVQEDATSRRSRQPVLHDASGKIRRGGVESSNTPARGIPNRKWGALLQLWGRCPGSTGGSEPTPIRQPARRRMATFYTFRSSEVAGRPAGTGG